MAVTQYIGSRYVPLFADPVEWSSTKSYESLTIVLHEGNSYTSKQPVPVGIEITNGDYWVCTGNYNAQVEQYRRDVANLESTVENVSQSIPISYFDTSNTVKKYIDDSNEDLRDYVEGVESTIENVSQSIPISDFDSLNTVKKYIDDSDEDLRDYITDGLYDEPSYTILFDGYDTNTNNYVSCVRMPRTDYAMNQFIPYSVMTAALDYKQVFKNYHNTVFVAPNLPSDYLIRDGVATGSTYEQVWCLLCVDENDNYSIEEVYGPASGIDTSSMIARGIKQALIVWEPIYMSGIPYNTYHVPDTMTSKETILFDTHPRTVIGWDNSYIYLIVVSGSIPFSSGATHDDLIRIVASLDISNAINCDGGGSTQLWLCPSGINLCYMRNADTTQQHTPGNSRAKPMTGFGPKAN